MWVNSVPRLPLDLRTFDHWYQEVHIPEIIAAKPGRQGCVAAWRFECQDSSRLRPFLALYSVPDMAFIQSPEFGGIRQTHEMLPDGGPSQKFVDFDTRFYQRIQVFEKPKKAGQQKGIGRVIKSTAIQPSPGLEEEFNRWYQEEHLEQVSRMPGWTKSTRYELIFKVQNKDDMDAEEAPKYLALHEFDEGTEVKRMKREEWTPWTVRMVESALAIDEAMFHYVWGMGEDESGL